MRDYTKIDAWRLADDLTVAIYERTRAFPREELYGLTSQLRRSASSVAANIVEGALRESQKDYLHFLYIARGSLAETQYFIHLAQRLQYLDEKSAEQLTAQGRQAFACLYGLTSSVEKNAGKIARLAAAVTSLVVISIVRLTGTRGPI
ncbi:MAG: four helix bundle protein [Opitutaceae bacterium]|nr:four helix bundle protein [Opitutaceae bacterium]